MIQSIRGTVHYWIHRNDNVDAKCIVFSHGLTANHTMFEKQVEYFSKEYTVVTWDVPLHGESRPYDDFSYRNTAVELKAILDGEKIEQVILVGMSMGGYPSQAFALQYPHSVLGFVALDTTPLNPYYYSKFDRWCLKKVKPLAKPYSDKILRKAMAKSVSKTQYAYDMMMEMLTPLSKEDLVEQMDIAYGCFIDECVNTRLECPVIILLGEYDKTGKVKKYCETWSEREGYPLHIIKGAAHFSNADNYKDVNELISKFIAEL